MEIPRQKKTVRVAVTGPSVKKGVIRCQFKTDAQTRVSGQAPHAITMKVWRDFGALFKE
jgi:hypothetical protein